MKDDLFEKVEAKTNVDKNTIVELAKKVNDNGLKDEKTLRDVIKQLSDMTGKNVSSDMEEKIINAVMEDKIPTDVEKMF